MSLKLKYSTCRVHTKYNIFHKYFKRVYKITTRERSLGVRWAQLFNLLPENIRSMNTDHVDFFKNHLDVFLSSIPDQPTVTGLGRAAESNSLLHQLPLFYSQTV
jgi:hypothetical protein